jgi:hypothetical protein
MRDFGLKRENHQARLPLDGFPPRASVYSRHEFGAVVPARLWSPAS